MGVADFFHLSIEKVNSGLKHFYTWRENIQLQEEYIANNWKAIKGGNSRKLKHD